MRRFHWRCSTLAWKVPRRGIAAVGAVAVLGLALHTDSRAAHPAPAASLAARLVPASVSLSQMLAPVTKSGTGARSTGATSTGRTAAGAATTFRQIILPDLLIVAPKGLTDQQIAALNKISGVRNVITFDGAEIKEGKQPVSVIGVNPATFRSWVPLSTASDQAFWSDLSSGDFVASVSARQALGLTPGDSYQLAGASTQTVRFGMASTLGLNGVDLLVNQATSQRLGLVHQVAGLISAPGVTVSTLSSEVSKVLGAGGKVEVLRAQQPTAAAPVSGQPTNYLQLFQASAADYCPGLSWTVLAAIAQIESADGANIGPSSAGALGPMQFLPSTWAIWGIDAFGQTGAPNVLNPYDAVPSAARLLCADGAAAGGQSLADAIFDYNHADWYVKEVLELAAQYAADYG